MISQGERDGVLDLLEATQIPEADGSFHGVTGLQVLLEAWCENAETFIGTWALRCRSVLFPPLNGYSVADCLSSSYVALSQLFLSGRPSLQQLQVKGDLIVTAETANGGRAIDMSKLCTNHVLSHSYALTSQDKLVSVNLPISSRP